MDEIEEAIRERDEQRLEWAKDLKELYSEATKDFTIEQVADIWSDHSHEVFAGWLTHTGYKQELMQEIFDQYHIKDGKIFKTQEI